MIANDSDLQSETKTLKDREIKREYIAKLQDKLRIEKEKVYALKQKAMESDDERLQIQQMEEELIEKEEQIKRQNEIIEMLQNQADLQEVEKLIEQQNMSEEEKAGLERVAAVIDEAAASSSALCFVLSTSGAILFLEE